MNTILTNKIEQFIREMPKVELHLHLEGAIPLETLLNFIKRERKEPSIKTIEDLRKKLTYSSFEHFIEVWIWKNTFINYERDFKELVYQVLRTLSQQNVKYAEITYSPGDYWRIGLSARKITEYLIEGKEKAYHDFNIRSELIVDLIRDHGPEIGMHRLDELTPYQGKGLIGITIGGSEQSFPPDPYTHVYKEAKNRGFRLTAHAGEAAGAGSIWAAINKLGVERVGHGIRANEDIELVSFLKKKKIPLEMCVISNIKTGVCKCIEEHPIKQYFNQGLIVTVNSDDPTMFNTTITMEFLELVKRLNFTLDDIKKLTLNGIDSSFMLDNEKESMKSQFEEEWQKLLSKYH